MDENENDHIPLLGKSIYEQTPAEYYSFVCGLRKTPKNKKKTEPKLKGRIKITATKTRVGVYELSYTGTNAEFKFNKQKKLIDFNVKELAEALKLSEQQIMGFILIKNYSA